MGGHSAGQRADIVRVEQQEANSVVWDCDLVTQTLNADWARLASGWLSALLDSLRSCPRSLSTSHTH